MTFLDSQLSFPHLVAKLMEIKNILTRICLKWFVNDSELSCYDVEMNLNDLSRCSNNLERERPTNCSVSCLNH